MTRSDKQTLQMPHARTIEKLLQVTQQRDDLLAASKAMLAFHEREHEQFNKTEPEVNVLRAAIAAAGTNQ